MADASDSKSDDGNIVWVQVPPPAPFLFSERRSSFLGRFFISLLLVYNRENKTFLNFPLS